MKSLVVDTNTVVPFACPGDERVYTSQCVIEPDGTGSQDLFMSRYTLLAGQSNKGAVHAQNDEVYYVLTGEAVVMLGNPGSPQAATEYVIKPDMAVFIPAGTFHALRNPSDRDFVILGIWPREPKPGSNGIHEARKKAWGTSFKTTGLLPRGTPVETRG